MEYMRCVCSECGFKFMVKPMDDENEEKVIFDPAECPSCKSKILDVQESTTGDNPIGFVERTEGL